MLVEDVVLFCFGGGVGLVILFGFNSIFQEKRIETGKFKILPAMASRPAGLDCFALCMGFLFCGLSVGGLGGWSGFWVHGRERR